MRHHIFPVLLFMSALALPALAQDGHYWDNQYGTKGELLGGLVVGSPSDLSASFYNPGWVALHGDNSVLLTTRAAEAYTIKVEDGLGADRSLSSTTVTTSPGYLAGRFSSGDKTGWQWAYSYLQKVKFDFGTEGNRILDNPSPQPTEAQWFSGEALRRSEANEYWYGVTMSKQLSEHVGFGFSPYVVQRSMKSRFQFTTAALTGSQQYSQVLLVDAYDFWNVRLLGKIGLAVDQGNLTYGLSITTPSLNLAGSGKVFNDINYSGVDVDGDGTDEPPYLAANYQEDLKSSWNSPFSAALGAAWTSGATGFYFTTEWFSSLSTNQVMDPASFTSQSNPDETLNYDLDYGAKSILNWGVGFERTFTEKLAMYGAFRSDYTSIPDNLSGEIQVSVWDLWHITGGTMFTFLDVELTLGAQYSWGSAPAKQFINFDPENLDGVIGDLGDTEVTYKRLKLLIGFNLPFGNNSEGVVPGS